MSQRYPGLDTHQPDLELIPFEFNGTGTASMTFGGSSLTLTDNGTGDYTLTPKRAGGVRLWCVAHAIHNTSALFVTIDDTNTTASAVNLRVHSDAGAATDAKVSGFILLKRGSTES